ALPFRQGGEIIGSLQVYAPEPGYFSDTITDLLQEATRAIGVALDRYQREMERDQLVEIIEATPDYIGMADADGRPTYHNPAAARLLATSLDDLTESASVAAFHPAWARRQLEEEGLPTAAAAGHWEGESAIVSEDGREIPVSQLIIGHRDQHGSLTRFSTVMRDLSPIKEAERFNRQLLESLAEGVFGVDRQGRFTFLNPAALALFGLEDEQTALGRDAHGFVHHTDARGAALPRERCPILYALEHGEAVRAWEDLFWKLGRHSFSVEVAATPLRDSRDRIQGAVVSFQNISRRKEAEQALAEQEAHYRDLVENQPEFVERYLPDTTITFANHALAKLFGSEPDEMVGKAWIAFLSPTEQEAARAHLAQFTPDNPVATFENAVTTADGQQRWVHWTNRAFFDDAGEISHFQSLGVDITDRRELEAEQRLLATAFQTSQALLITDARATIERVNSAFTAITGYAPEEVVGKNPRMFSSGYHDTAFYRAMWASLTTHGHWEGEVWNRRKDGTLYPQWESISAVHNEAGEVEHYVAVFHDISEQKRLEDELERLATHDRLTGIYNRAKLYDLLNAAKDTFERYATPCSLIMLDIDHFKSINDGLGHGVGDAVLKNLTRRIADEMRSGDHFGRWGGEEFLIIAGHTDLDGAHQLAERVRRAVADSPFADAGKVTISLGVAEIRGGESLEHLEERADGALYAAKAAGRNRVETA
ncbi:MAG TPA: PAS domain S-box protein, partial [Gammaproteobacteria bacterium]|nr:PAS domain S-box protein [Gammaproteobacteria bacterium]